MKGDTATNKPKCKAVGAGNSKLAMDEVALLAEVDVMKTTPDGKPDFKNSRIKQGPFHWIADYNDPGTRLDVGDFSIYIPVVEDYTEGKVLYDLTVRWWREKTRALAKQRGRDTISILVHPNTGVWLQDHTEWAHWWDSDHRYA